MPSAVASKIDNSIDHIAQTIWKQHQAGPPTKRTLVSISGIPGSGKSTLARSLVEKLNAIYFEANSISPKIRVPAHADISNSSPTAFAIDIPMDGYHLSRAQLRALPNPETAIHRRGAAFTYDAAGYCRLVEQLAKPVDIQNRSTIYAPAFDHATKDPVQDSIKIGKETRIVLLEGNYVNLHRKPWSAAAKLFDVRLMVAVDRGLARGRLVKRHVASGICVDEASAWVRVQTTDELNAEDILAHRVEGVLEVLVQD